MKTGIPFYLEDWGDNLDYWEHLFVDRKARYYSEDFYNNGDAASVTSPPRIGYLHFTGQSYKWNITSTYNDVKWDESAFYHTADPACLVAYSDQGAVQLRWRPCRASAEVRQFQV